MQGFPFPIITYQVITGNYSEYEDGEECPDIITYQVITGNYSYCSLPSRTGSIITYQVITGNYSRIKSTPPYSRDYNIPSNNRELQLTGSM